MGGRHGYLATGVSVPETKAGAIGSGCSCRADPPAAGSSRLTPCLPPLPGPWLPEVRRVGHVDISTCRSSDVLSATTTHTSLYPTLPSSPPPSLCPSLSLLFHRLQPPASSRHLQPLTTVAHRPATVDHGDGLLAHEAHGRESVGLEVKLGLLETRRGKGGRLGLLVLGPGRGDVGRLAGRLGLGREVERGRSRARRDGRRRGAREEGDGAEEEGCAAQERHGGRAGCARGAS